MHRSDILVTWQFAEHNTEQLFGQRANVKEKYKFFELVAILEGKEVVEKANVKTGVLVLLQTCQ